MLTDALGINFHWTLQKMIIFQKNVKNWCQSVFFNLNFLTYEVSICIILGVGSNLICMIEFSGPSVMKTNCQTFSKFHQKVTKISKKLWCRASVAKRRKLRLAPPWPRITLLTSYISSTSHSSTIKLKNLAHRCSWNQFSVNTSKNHHFSHERQKLMSKCVLES